MALRNFDQLSANDLSALLGGHGGQNNNAHSMASLLFAQQQQQQQHQQQQQGHHSAFASLAALNGGNMPTAQQFAAMSAGQGQNNSANQAAEQQYQSQTTQLLTALLEQQQREDKRKAELIAQLNNVLHQGGQGQSGQQQHQQAPAPSDNLAMLLQQKQMALANQGNANPLSLLGGSPQIQGASASMFGGMPQHGGQMNANAIAKFLQSQQPPQQQAIHQQSPPQQVQVPQVSQAASVATGASHSVASAHTYPINGNSSANALLNSADALSLPADRRRKGRTGTFPQKLHQMLSDLERQEGGTDIASFLPHGRAFAIHKPRDFVKHVMPKYFRMSRFSSFQRQLNLYDFQRITEGPDKGSYYHELFVQGRPILSTMMKRNKIKGVKNLKNQDGEEEKAEEKEEAPLKEDEGEEEDEEDVE